MKLFIVAIAALFPLLSVANGVGPITSTTLDTTASAATVSAPAPTALIPTADPVPPRGLAPTVGLRPTVALPPTAGSVSTVGPVTTAPADLAVTTDVSGDPSTATPYHLGNVVCHYLPFLCKP